MVRDPQVSLLLNILLLDNDSIQLTNSALKLDNGLLAFTKVSLQQINLCLLLISQLLVSLSGLKLLTLHFLSMPLRKPGDSIRALLLSPVHFVAMCLLFSVHFVAMVLSKLIHFVGMLLLLSCELVDVLLFTLGSGAAPLLQLLLELSDLVHEVVLEPLLHLGVLFDLLSSEIKLNLELLASLIGLPHHALVLLHVSLQVLEDGLFLLETNKLV